MTRESTIYQAIIAECECMETKKIYSGNGHHLAQRLARMVEDGFTKEESVVVEESRILRQAVTSNQEAWDDGWDACAKAHEPLFKTAQALVKRLKAPEVEKRAPVAVRIAWKDELLDLEAAVKKASKPVPL